MKSISKVNLSDQIVDGIIEDIKKGTISAGDKLPSETQLAKQLGVARHAVREALRKLEQMAIIETATGLGSFVKKDAPSDFAPQLTSLLVFNAINERDVFEIRVALETHAASMAAERLTLELAERLQEDIAQMEAAMSDGDFEAYAVANVDFHERIISATNNKIFMIMYRTITELIIQTQDRSNRSQSMECSIKGHKNILDALQRRDAQRAVENVREHLYKRYK